ncbi:MAG: hypothetical protein ACO1OB_27420 [Archangium sp.]
MKKLVLLSLFVVGCRTEIQPVVKGAAVTRRVKQADGECHVIDYPMATDLPSGAKSIGWVKVERKESDEKTFEALRQEVCAKGGDAMSQMHWIRASGASVADQPIELEGNAWSLP